MSAGPPPLCEEDMCSGLESGDVSALLKRIKGLVDICFAGLIFTARNIDILNQEGQSWIKSVFIGHCGPSGYSGP